jgi:hypothetical protein
MLSATHGTTIYCAASASALAQSYAEMLAPQPLQTRTSNTPALTLLRTPLPRRREKKEEDAPRALHHAEENARAQRRRCARGSSPVHFAVLHILDAQIVHGEVGR